MTFRSFNLYLAFLLTSFHANALIRALDTAATGMAAQEAQLSTISNNIANSSTTGYKVQRTEFQDLIYETVVTPGGRSSGNTQYNVGVQVGSGAKIKATRRLHSMGSPQVTNNPYDLMIFGDGFFAVQMRDQIFYTRDGSFTVNAQGVLQTKDGNQLLPQITLPPATKTLVISQDGKVQAYLTSQTEPVELGQIPVYTFVNPAGLIDIGGNLARVTPASGEPIQNVAGSNNAGAIQQGSIETSNVNTMTEMTNMIKAQRAFEMNSKVLSVADQMLQTINQVR